MKLPALTQKNALKYAGAELVARTLHFQNWFSTLCQQVILVESSNAVYFLDCAMCGFQYGVTQARHLGLGLIIIRLVMVSLGLGLQYPDGLL